MKLLMVRHAKAVHSEIWKKKGGQDLDRPLTPEGHKKFKQVAQGLREIIDGPLAIFSSPSKRTMDTASVLAEWFSAGAPYQATWLLQQAPVSVVQKNLKKAFHVQSKVAIVGHESHLAKIMAAILDVKSLDRFHFKKGGCAMLSFDALGGDLRGQLKWMITPNMILKMCGLPKLS